MENFSDNIPEFKDSELYTALLQSVPDPLVIYDLQGNPKFVNHNFTETFGYTLEEYINRENPFVPPHLLDSTIAKIKDVIENNHPCRDFETERYTKDGRLLNINISAARITNKDDNPIGMIVILRDITERKKIERKINELEKAELMEKIAAGIAHEFNNILTSLQGYIDIINLKLNNYPEEIGLKDHIKKIELLIDKSADLTKKLQTFSKRNIYNPSLLKFNTVIKNILLAFATIKKRVYLNVNLSQADPTVHIDETQIEQALMTILINAAEATSNKGVITITTEEVKGSNLLSKFPASDPQTSYISVTISDNGIGMDKYTTQNIFKPFINKQQEGLSIGLASAYKIINTHKGFIEVFSELEKGSTFNIYLPIYEK